MPAGIGIGKVVCYKHVMPNGISNFQVNDIALKGEIWVAPLRRLSTNWGMCGARNKLNSVLKGDCG